MRLLRLELRNFRGFAERAIQFHPSFNVVIGTNGTGKTSVLEAAAVAIGSWLQGFHQTAIRKISNHDVRRIEQVIGDRVRELPQLPVIVAAEGQLPFQLQKGEEPTLQLVHWSRTLLTPRGKVDQSGNKQIKDYSYSASNTVLSGEKFTLPVLRYFGAGRLWVSAKGSENSGKSGVPRETKLLPNSTRDLSDPFYGYKMSIDKRANPADLIYWMAEERRNEIDINRGSIALRLVFDAILSMLPELIDVRYELRRKVMILEHRDGRLLTFQDMSDGYRNIIAMAADLAIRMVMLNPHLEQLAIRRTPGIVLIDEIDLHLHPTWQRRVTEDFRRTFPLVQFICTSHSPFIVQSLRSGEELIVLDGEPTSETANLTLEDVAEGLMRVENAEVGQRYFKMKETAQRFLEDLEKADLSNNEKFERFKRRLAEDVTPYADNPAYQAFLEMKLAARSGGRSK